MLDSEAERRGLFRDIEAVWSEEAASLGYDGVRNPPPGQGFHRKTPGPIGHPKPPTL